MAYRIIPAPPSLDHGPRGGPARAMLFHHAEGVNVATYLSRNPMRGVSVNFTIEQKTSIFDDGEIIAMVPLGRISGSANPQAIRTDNDPAGSLGSIANDPKGFYGATVAKQLLGSGWRDPNRWVVGVELAGQWSKGPTKAQVESMRELIAHCRRAYPSLKGNLGHRDLQRQKMCPGRLIPWSEVGGHGLFRAVVPAPVPQEGDEMIVDLNVRRTALVPAGVSIAERSGGPEVAKTSDEQRRFVPGFSLDLKYAMVASDFGASPGFSRGLFVDAKALKDIQVAPDEPLPEPVPGCTPEELNAANNLGFNSALTAAQAAILAIAPREDQP